MNNRSKRFSEAAKLIDQSKKYAVAEAIELTKKASTTKFDAGIEVHIRTGVDPKKADQVVRGSVVLPHGSGKTKKITVFCEGKDQEIAKKEGAVLVGGDELIAEIKKTKKCDFDLALATPTIMKKMGQIAKILGPKGLMPNPRNETISNDIKKTMQALSKGKITFRNDDTSNVHQLIGKASFETKQINENFDAFLDAVRKAKPTGLKGKFIIGVSICSSMGPSISIAV